MTPEHYVARLRHELALRQLGIAVAGAAIPSHTVLERLAALEAQQREVSEVRLFGQQFLPQTSIDDAKIKAYYDANPGEFRTPERVRAEYVVLSADSSGAAGAGDRGGAEGRLRAARRAVQHAASSAARATSWSRPRTRRTRSSPRLRKTPARFAELAKKHSQDTGSAEKGGDLGWFGRGMMTRSFAEAVFAMKQGEIARR